MLSLAPVLARLDSLIKAISNFLFGILIYVFEAKIHQLSCCICELAEFVLFFSLNCINIPELTSTHADRAQAAQHVKRFTFGIIIIRSTSLPEVKQQGRNVDM